MMRTVCVCKALIYIDNETNHRFNSQSADDPHRCQSALIPLYTEIYGIKVRRSEQSIAASITDEALKMGLNPYRAHGRRKGDWLEVVV